MSLSDNSRPFKIMMMEDTGKAGDVKLDFPMPEISTRLIAVGAEESGQQIREKPHMDVGFRTADGKYVCRICGRKFANRFSLTGHYKSHYEYHEKPYSCIDCGLRYTSPSNLHHHRAKKCCILKLKNLLKQQNNNDPSVSLLHNNSLAKGRMSKINKSNSTVQSSLQSDMTYLVQKAIKVIERRNWLSNKPQGQGNDKSIYKSNSLLRSFAIKELIDIIGSSSTPSQLPRAHQEIEKMSSDEQPGVTLSESSLAQISGLFMGILKGNSEGVDEEIKVEEVDDDSLPTMVQFGRSEPKIELKFSIRSLDVETKPLDLTTRS